MSNSMAEAPPQVLARLTVAWPGAALLHGEIRLSLDGRPFFTGRFEAPFRAECAAPPGDHVLEAAIPILGSSLLRRREYRLALAPGVWEADLRYSRLWGNFAGKLTLRRVA